MNTRHLTSAFALFSVFALSGCWKETPSPSQTKRHQPPGLYPQHATKRRRPLPPPPRPLGKGIKQLPPPQLKKLRPPTPPRPDYGDYAPYTIRHAAIPQRVRRQFGTAKYTILISLDGVSYHALRRNLHRLEHIKSLIKGGFWRPMQVAFPSVTWASHASMVTGQYPRHHGILANRWLENNIDLIYPYQTDYVEPYMRKRTPSLYDMAAARGWKTAALNWPSTQKARQITYNLPEIMYSNSLAYRLLSPSLRRVIRGMYFREHNQIHQWRRKHIRELVGRIAGSEKIETDMFVRDVALKLINAPRKKRPKLMLLHFVSPDSWMHKYGPSPWIQRWALEQMDMAIGKVIKAYKRAGIWSKTSMFVTSDHGFLKIRYKMALRKLLRKKGYSRYRSMIRRNRKRERVMAFFNGHVAFLYIKENYKESYTPALIKLLKMPEYKTCIQYVLRPEEYKKLGFPIPQPKGTRNLYGPGQHPGAPDLLLIAQHDCTFQRGRYKRVINPAPGGRIRSVYGAHGYLPTEPRMWGILIGHGAGIRARRTLSPMNRAYIVDIAPTMAQLMGLRWPTKWPSKRRQSFRLDGRILKDILR